MSSGNNITSSAADLEPDPNVFGPLGTGSVSSRYRHPDPKTVLRIRIRMFLGVLDPDPYPLVRGADPSIIRQNR